ncbi:MAG: JAB domain-containing protein [Alphaproteobacteria bacterium]
MSTPDNSFHKGHRERLRQKFLDDKLVVYEKLELLLGYIIPRQDVKPLAHRLLNQFGTLSQVFSAPMEQLLTCEGVGKNTAIFIKLLNEIMKDGYKSDLDKRPIFHNPEILKNYCKCMLAGKSVEECHVLYLDSDYRLLVDDLHSRGTYNESSVYPREIIKRALSLNARSIVMVHNHPVSDAGFSSDDVAITEYVNKLSKELGIQLYDHLLVSKYVMYSARDMGLFQ